MTGLSYKCNGGRIGTNSELWVHNGSSKMESQGPEWVRVLTWKCYRDHECIPWTSLWSIQPSHFLPNRSRFCRCPSGLVPLELRWPRVSTSLHIYIYIHPGQFICFKNNHICNFLCLDQGSRTQKLSVKEQDRIYLEEFLGLTKMFLRSLRTNLLPTLSLTKMDGSLIFLLSNETRFNLLLPNYFLLLLNRILLCLIFFIQCYFCGHTTIYL